MRNKVQLALTVIFICLFSAAAYAVSIWGASDRAPATGTMRFPVDTTSSSSPGYLEVQDVANFTYANGVGSDRYIIFNSGGALTGVAGLTYSPAGLLTATSFAGALTGNATTATALAANGSNCSAGSAPLGVDASGAVESCTDYEEDLSNSAGLRGALSDESGTGVAYFQGGDLGTPSAGILTNATGTAAGLTAGAATLAASSTIIDGTDSTSFPLIVDSATGDLALKTDGGLLYNASNGTLSSTIFNTPILTLTGTGTLNGLDAIDGTTEATLEAALDLNGDVSSNGLSSTVIGADKVTEAMLKAVDAASDEECLTYETTTGDFEWQTCGAGGSYANSAALASDLSDETGTAFVVFSDSPVFTTQITTPLIALSGTGTINGLDAIDGTTETTLEAAIDIAGDVSGTGLGSVTIGADKVLESMLKAVDAASDEECLTYETTTGDFEWQSCGGGGSLSDGDKGDIVVSGSGATWAIDTGVIVNADVNASAAIDATKIHDGTISNTEFGYLNGVTSNIQTQIDGLTASGFAAYTDGGTNSFAVDSSFTSTIDSDSDTSFAIGIGNDIGAARGHDWITAIGSDITADGNAVVVIGRLGVVDCVNGVSIGDGNTLNCSGGVTEKSAIFGNDNNYSGVMDHFYGIGSNNTSTTGCRQCGIFGENITNDKNGSFGIGNPSLAGGAVTVGTTNTIWFADELYVKMGGDTETDVTALTCNSTARGLTQFNTSEGALNVCDGSAWQSIPMVPTAGANNVAISQYAMTYLDETSEANLKAALNIEAGVDFQAYDADLATLAAGGAAFTALAGNATKPDLYADLGAGYTVICRSGSDFNSTALTASTGVIDEWLPIHATFTVAGVYASVRTAPSADLTIDINEGAGAGTSILSTKIVIQSGEYNGGSSGWQGTAAAAAVISDTSIAAFPHITADIDSTTGGKGLEVCLVGYY